MKIENISIDISGYVTCKSSFYSVEDVIDCRQRTFSSGSNWMHGEIDSGIWGISYLLSMYGYSRKKFESLHSTSIIVNNVMMSLGDLTKYSCYLDLSYPLFSSMQTVRRQVEKGLRKNHVGKTSNEICEMFGISRDRFDRHLRGVGNELFKAMAAINYCYGKEVYCFPWLSKRRFDGYHMHIVEAINILESLGKLIIIPIGY